jgi:hypothetical protein
MSGRALHAPGDAFDVAETQQLLDPLLDTRRGDQTAIRRTQPNIPGQLPDKRFLQWDARCGEKLRK